MLPRLLTLVLICISSAFLKKDQDRGNFIPATTDFHYNNKDTVFCNCSTSPQIVPINNQGTNRTYQGIPNAACTSIQTKPVPATAEYKGPAENKPDTCGVSNVTYSWSIAIG